MWLTLQYGMIFQTLEFPIKPRTHILTRVSMKVDVLRILIRLAQDTKAIDQKKYAVLQDIINEIGRMLGGWMKAGK